MKKITTKTLTFHTALNYGAILQTIGLQKTLYNLNCENSVINYTDKCMNQYNPKNLDNLPRKEKAKKILRYILYGRKLTKRQKKLTSFINENINMTKKVYNMKEIENIIEKDDVLIAGSDQIWSTEIMDGLSDIYTLNFKGTNNKKISYAASIGSSTINEKYYKEFQNKINNIDRISVREESLKSELIKIVNKKNIDVVLDPTMLLTKEQWKSLINKHEKEEKEKYIVAYTLDVNPEYIKIVNELSKKTCLRVIYFDYRNYGFDNILREGFLDNPFEFVNCIKNAQYIVTTSFHGTVFSLLFNKKFWVIPHRTRGARMTDLLYKVGLNKRIVKTVEEFNKKDFDENINYNYINELLSKQREESINWLINAINDERI